ncbi:probable cytochrome P450 12a4, mitochondrial isoform X2 [Uloborus diversus]|uniref:probable cytochrome P450 12a4, mitochondrial isoform X2 n=1 Tax=Uloborus diversus TaxID=327109 RepID=UPI00240A51C4|nr:probable cytochrome P450 12a4, mitochondrial isoform X2 [Uloborus diversus]
MKMMLRRSLLRTACGEWAFFHELQLNSIRSAATANTTSHQDVQLSSAKPYEDIPHLPMLPFVGTAWAYWPIVGRYSTAKFHKAAHEKRKRFGDIHREKFGALDIVFSFRAEDMETVSRNEGPYPNKAEFTTIKAYRESRKEWKGKEWHDLRSKTQKHLMKPKAIEAYMIPMQDVAQDFIKKIFLARDSSKEVPYFLEELYKWALESIAVIGLDTRLECLQKDLPNDSDGMKMINSVQTQFHLMTELEGFAGSLALWKYFSTPKWRKFTQASDVFTEIAFKYINRALEELKKIDGTEEKELTLLQAMLTTKGLDVSSAMVTVADMLISGIDTTSHTVGFLLYHLARNPDKQEKLYHEVLKAFPSKESKMSPTVFAELRYLKCCFKESQRLHPIVSGLARVLDRDVVLSGYRVPAGTMISVMLQEIYRREEYYKKPLEFLPERWLAKDKDFYPFSFLPFGFGRRSCIGRRLAETEVIILTSEIIRNFRVEYHHEDIDMMTTLVSTPDKPLRFNFIER